MPFLVRSEKQCATRDGYGHAGTLRTIYPDRWTLFEKRPTGMNEKTEGVEIVIVRDEEHADEIADSTASAWGHHVSVAPFEHSAPGVPAMPFTQFQREYSEKKERAEAAKKKLPRTEPPPVDNAVVGALKEENAALRDSVAELVKQVGAMRDELGKMAAPKPKRGPGRPPKNQSE